MFDPQTHRLEVAHLAIRRWQDELCRIDDEPDPVRREARRQEALGQINRAWDRFMEELSDG